MLTKILLCFVLVASILVPGGYYLFSEKKAGNFKAALGFNVLFFFGTLIVSDIDRKSTRLNSSHLCNLVCRLLLEKNFF